MQGYGGGVPQSPGSCPESESDSESASKSRTPTPGTRPVSSVVLDSNGRPVDRLLIKNVENFYFLFDGFPYVIAPVFSTPAFSTPAFSAPPE